MTYSSDNRPNVIIGETTTNQSIVEFKYAQPSISVNTSARYTTHEPIGNTVVRQKLGTDPAEISINGHCTEQEAYEVDDLTERGEIELISARWEGFAHVASTNTKPIADGGGKDIDGDWVYSFTIELVETYHSETEEGYNDLPSDVPTQENTGPNEGPFLE